MKKNLLVTLADKNYLDFAKQLFSSVYFNAGWQGDYMLLAHEVPEDDLAWFREKGVLIKECRPLAKKLPGRWPILILDKFYLFTQEFKRWGKIIYLDADMMVTASLDDLLKVTKIGGVKNFFWTTRKLKYYRSYWDKDNQTRIDKSLNWEAYVFASGIMAIDTEIITPTTFDDLCSAWQNYPKIPSGADEISLNLVFNNQWEDIATGCAITTDQPLACPFLKPEQIKGVIINYFAHGWKREAVPYFYNLWLSNLARSNEIDLTQRPAPTKIWRHYEIWVNFSFLQLSVWLSKIYHWSKTK